MRKLIILFVCLCSVHILSAQLKLEDVVKPGSKLIYGVEANGMNYDFVVTVVKLKPAVEFNWEMTAPVDNSGTIVHTEKAMASANTLFNYFSGGKKTLDDNTLSVWLSQQTLTGLKGGKGIPVAMNVGDEPKTMGTTTDPIDLYVMIDGKKQKIKEHLAVELNNGKPVQGDFITYYNSPKLPIILRMQNGFYIGLKEVK